MAPCGRKNIGGGGRATKSPQIDPQVFQPSIPSSVEPSNPDPKS
ncbi:unnamed protein product [Arabidopsis lyrata]|nr:unnamed protein product [Arabidopsis lyrata]